MPPSWYSLVMMGLHTCSSSFCRCSYSSLSASWFVSSHLMVSSTFSRIFLRSSSDSLSLSFSSSTVDLMLNE
uniref:Putative secreted protein n=1 Tax=Ixodes ricinus TaxID=34613 RepID=A0A6B0TXV6_IXORI